MINVKKDSMWYRLALYGVLFEEYKIEKNLCPFMRRVILGLFLCCIYSIIIALLVFSFFWPIVIISHTILFGDLYYQIHKSIPWFVGIGEYILIISAFLVYYFTDTKQGIKLKEHFDEYFDEYFDENISKKVDDNLIWKWIVAKHNQICPQLTFNGNYKDANIKLFTNDKNSDK